MPKPLARKFVSPAFSGEMVSEGNGGFKEKSSQKKEKAMPNSLSDSQYEEIFSQVIKNSVSKGSYVDDDSAEEDNVVIPEPDAALSPVEEAEETNFDVVSNGSATLTKTPMNPIDNSILPPLKKKKPESRIKKLGLKLKPTRLNFDDPELKDERYASCSAKEHGPTPLEEEDLIHNIYTAGSLVWARLAGYPWWPAMVDDDPDVEQYYWITEYCDIPTHYNVSFFDEKPVTRAWLTPSGLTKYVNNEKRKDLLKMTANGIDYSHRIKVAMEQANEAAKLPVAERLKKFSFAVRYKGPIGKKRQLVDSSEEKGNKAKKSKKEKKGEMPDSLGDSQASILRSLEVVKEVNEVLSQITSDSESEGSEEDPQIDLNKSMEEVNEVNEVLNLLSDCESVGIDDDELEEYLKSVQKRSSSVQRSEEKLVSKPKKKFTKPSADKERDKHKEYKEKKNSMKDSEKRKHGLGHSSSSKEPKSDNKGSSFMGNKKAERNEKSKDRSHESKDKREKMHTFKDSRKEKSERGKSSSPKESQQNLKRSDTSKSECSEKHKKSFKKGHEVQIETEKKNSVQEKIKEKHVSKQGMSDVAQKKVHSDSKKRETGTKHDSKQGMSDVAQKKVHSDSRKRETGTKHDSKQVMSDVTQKKVHSDSKKRETGTKENKGHSGRTETTDKGEGSPKGEQSGDHSGKLKKAIEKGKAKRTERAEGKTKMETKDMKKHDEGSKGEKASSSSAHSAKKGSPKLSEAQQRYNDEEKDSGKDRNVIDSCQDIVILDEQLEEERLKEGRVDKTKDLEEEDNIEEGEKMEEENEGESTNEEGGKRSEGEHSGGRAATDNEKDQVGSSSLASTLSNGRASVDIFKEDNEEDAASVASEKSADFDFEE